MCAAFLQPLLYPARLRSRSELRQALTFPLFPRQIRPWQLLPFPFSGPQSKSTTAAISQAKINPATKARYATKYDRSPCTSRHRYLTSLRSFENSKSTSEIRTELQQKEQAPSTAKPQKFTASMTTQDKAFKDTFEPPRGRHPKFLSGRRRRGIEVPFGHHLTADPGALRDQPKETTTNPFPPPSDPPLAAPVFSPVRASVEGDISQAKIGPATKARYATKPKKKGAKGIKERLRRGPKSSPADGPRPDASRATAPHRPWQDAVRTPPFDPSPTRRAGLHGTYLSIPRQPLREPLVINE